MIKQNKAFTLVEIIFAIVLIGLASLIFFNQKNNLEIVARDKERKIAINAMYYGLEKVFYPTNKYYPQTIDGDVLYSVDPELFNDPNGIKLGDSGSNYIYTPINCSENKCKGYSLRATLENEDDYIKNND